MDKKLVCPVCGGTLRYERLDDGISIVDIKADGSGIDYFRSWSDGSTIVYCITDDTHKIDDATWHDAVSLVEDEGY